MGPEVERWLAHPSRPRGVVVGALAGLVSGLVAGLLLGSATVSPAAAQDACPGAVDEVTRRGWEAFRRNEVDEARSLFSRAVSRCPGHVGARTGMGYVHLRRGVPETARVFFRQVLDAEPDNVDAHVGLGLLAWRSGDLDEVERRFRRVLELLPGDPTARRYLARVEEAREDEEAPADEADRAWQRGDRVQATRLYSARVSADSTDAPALHRLALLRARVGRHRRALELMERLLELRPSDVRARVDRARILAWSGEIDEALDRLEGVLEDHPTDLRALEAKAEIMTWPAERAVEARERREPFSGKRAAVPEPAFPGRPLVDPTGFDDAVAAFDSLTRSEPDALEHRIGLGLALTYAGRYDSARVVLRGVLERSPGNLRAQEGLARALSWDGRLQEGERAWRRVLLTDPRSADAWVGLAQNLRWQGRPASALSALDRAAEEAPGHPRVEAQRRWVRAAVAPRVRAEWSRRDDGSGQEVASTRLEGAWNPVPRASLRVRAGRSDADLSPRGLERGLQDALLSGTWEFEPGWAVTGGAGASESDGRRDPGQPELHLAAASPPGDPLSLRVRYDRRPLAETALQIDRSVERERWGGVLRWRPGARWSVAGRGGWSEYRGAERNTRWDAALGVAAHPSSRWTVGAGLRGFGFERDAGGAYFDPDLYALAEVEAEWSRNFERFSVELEAAPGVQRIGEDGDLAAAGRTRARLTYRAGPGRRIFVAGEYARNGLVATATGLEDYDYRSLRIGGSWSVY